MVACCKVRRLVSANTSTVLAFFVSDLWRSMGRSVVSYVIRRRACELHRNVPFPPPYGGGGPFTLNCRSALWQFNESI